MAEKNKHKLPPYVKMGDTALRLRGTTYWRDAGRWECEAAWVDGTLISVSDIPSVNGKVLTPISEAEYKNDNKGYI